MSVEPTETKTSTVDPRLADEAEAEEAALLGDKAERKPGPTQVETTLLSEPEEQQLISDSERLLYEKIYREAKQAVPLQAEYYMEMLAEPLPVVPEKPTSERLDLFNELLAQVTNFKSYVAELNLTILTHAHFWKALKKQIGRLYKIALSSRVKDPSIRSLSSRELRELASETKMLPILKLRDFIENKCDLVRTIQDMIDVRDGQLNDIYKAVSRQIAVVEMQYGVH